MRNLFGKFVLGLVLLTACAVCAEQVQLGDMVVTAPSGWVEAPVPETDSHTRSVFVSNHPKEKQAVLMLSVVPKKGRSFEAFNSATRRYIVKKMDGVLEFERSANIDGAPARTFVYEGRSGLAGNGRRKFMRTIVSKDDSFYILHGVANHIPFVKFAGTMEDVVKSVKWK